MDMCWLRLGDHPWWLVSAIMIPQLWTCCWRQVQMWTPLVRSEGVYFTTLFFNCLTYFVILESKYTFDGGGVQRVCIACEAAVDSGRWRTRIEWGELSWEGVLLTSEVINDYIQNGWTAVMFAMCNYQPEMVELLLAAGATFNTTDKVRSLWMRLELMKQIKRYVLSGWKHGSNYRCSL